jgi:hypothetical protein
MIKNFKYLFIFIFPIISGCVSHISSIYNTYTINQEIETICNDISSDTLKFIEKLNKDKMYETIEIGHNYKYVFGNYKYRKISFSVHKLYHDTVLVSAKFAPIVYFLNDNNINKFKDYGFQFDKIENYMGHDYEAYPIYYKPGNQFQIQKIQFESIRECIMNISSPFKESILFVEFPDDSLKIYGTYAKFRIIYQNISDNEIDFLLNSINPLGRAIGYSILKGRQDLFDRYSDKDETIEDYKIEIPKIILSKEIIHQHITVEEIIDIFTKVINDSI